MIIEVKELMITEVKELSIIHPSLLIDPVDQVVGLIMTCPSVVVTIIPGVINNLSGVSTIDLIWVAGTP